MWIYKQKKLVAIAVIFSLSVLNNQRNQKGHDPSSWHTYALVATNEATLAHDWDANEENREELTRPVN